MMSSQVSWQRVVLLLAFVAGSMTGCAGVSVAKATPAPEQVSLKLNWRHGSQFLGFYMAEGRGYYLEEGMTAAIEAREETTDAEGLINQVMAGNYDFGVSAIALLRAQGAGSTAAAFATIYRFAPVAFFARADSGIITPADFRGRTMVVKGAAWEDMLRALLESETLTLADVNTVPGGFDMAPFLDGQVDVWAGYLTDEVVRVRQSGVEIVTFPLDEYGIGSVANTLFSSRGALESDMGKAVRFLWASIKGWEWAVANPEGAVGIMIERFPEMAAEHDFCLASFVAAILLIRLLDAEIGAIDCEKWVSRELLAGLDSKQGLCTDAL